jgi:hypothetical protein
MEQAVIETWIYRAVIAVLLISFHWLGHLVKKRRQRARLLADAGGMAAANSKGRRISNDPIEPE